MSEENQNRLVMVAMTAIESGAPLKAAVAAALVKEIIRQRRMLESQERKIARLERTAANEMGAEEHLEVQRPVRAEGAASGEGDGVGG